MPACGKLKFCLMELSGIFSNISYLQLVEPSHMELEIWRASCMYHNFFIYPSISGHVLFPYLDYRENFCYAHDGADITLISVFVSSGFDLSLYIKSYMDYMIVLIFSNLYRGCINLHSHRTVHMGSLFFKFMSSLFYFISL